MSKVRIRTQLGCLLDVVKSDDGAVFLVGNIDDAGDDRRFEVLLDTSALGKLYRALGKLMPRRRSLKTAKDAGSWLETATTEYLQRHVDEHIFRQTKTGKNDRGDVGGVRIHGQKIAVECKNEAGVSLPQWTREAEAERGNLDALAGLVVHKRVGSMKPEEQWVSMTLGELAAILTGSREHYETEVGDEVHAADGG